MNRFCLDTSAYSNFKRGDERIVELLDGADWIGVPAVVIGELWAGFLQGDSRARNEAELREFLANPAVATIDVDESVGKFYAEILVALLDRGTPVPTNDVCVAACAVRSGSTVLTFDEHFRSIERVGALVLERGASGAGRAGQAHPR